MPRIVNSKLAHLGLSLSATLGLALTGCGGASPVTSDAVVFPEPGVNVAATSAPKPAIGTTAGNAATGSTAATTPAATTTASPSAPVKAEGWGTLKGQVTFSGTVPEALIKPLVEKGKAEKDADLCATDGPIKSEALIVDATTKGVKNVLVYLAKPTAVNEDAKKAKLASAPIFDQAKCIFDPHVMALMTDEPMTLKSSDQANHNVNVGLKNSSFNQTIAPGASAAFTLGGPERTPGTVVCNIHGWMKAYWMVLDHPYSVVTDAKGNFELKNVPAGTQRVVVWQESVAGAGFVTPASGDDVVIKAGDTVTKDFTIDAGKLRAAQ